MVAIHLYCDRLKSILSLQGPKPTEFQVSIHHEQFPTVKILVGVTEQVPVPLAQLSCAAVYHCWNGAPELSVTHR